MTPTLLSICILCSSPSADVQADGTIYRKFDHALMASITAKHAAKRDAARKYDPVTWLPIEPPRLTTYDRLSRKQAIAQRRLQVRSARMRMTAMRNKKRQQANGVDPMAWIFGPALPTKPCPWAWYSYARYYASR